jgi:hypothetical protein
LKDVSMAKVSEDPPSPVDAYAAAPSATPVGDPLPPPPPFYPAPTGYYAAPASAPTPSTELNVLALVALIASCFGLTIPGIVMGHIALSQIKKSGGSGHGLALAAVIVGYALFALTLVIVVVYVVFLFFIIGVAGSAANNFGDLGRPRMTRRVRLAKPVVCPRRESGSESPIPGL